MGELRVPSASWRFSRKQREVFNSSAKVKLIEAGRGGGKDIVCARAVIRDCFRLYAERKAALEAGATLPETNPLVRAVVAAPSSKHLEQVRSDYRGMMASACRDAGIKDDQLYQYHKADDCLRIIGHADILLIFMVASREDCFRGLGIDILHVTETAFMRDSFWQEAKPSLTRAGRAGLAYLNSTPRGPEGLFVDLCTIAQDETVESWCYWHWTSFENPFLGPDERAEIESEQRQHEAAGSSWVFEQERLAKRVVGDRGGTRLFERPDIEKCLVVRPKEKPDGKSRAYVCGVDVSRFGDDWTVLVVVDAEHCEVTEIFREQLTSGPAIISMIDAVERRYGPGVEFVLDSTQHQAFLQDFMTPGLRVQGLKIYDKMKERLLLNMRMALQMGRLRIPSPDEFPFDDERKRSTFRVLVAELCSFQKIVKADGKVLYRAPVGMHDDVVVALSYALNPILDESNRKLTPETATKTKVRLSKLFI